MDLKKIFWGGILGGLGPFILSGIWHLAIMKNVYYIPEVTGIVRPEPLLPLIALCYVILGWVMAYLYPFGYEGGAPIKEGIKFGIPIGLIMGLSTEMYKFAIFQFSTPQVLVVESIWRVIELCVAGVIIAMVYGKKTSPKKAGKKK